MIYRLIPPCKINIVKPIISSKPRVRVGFGRTMMEYEFMSPSTKVEVKGEYIYGQMMGYTYR